MRRTYRLEVKKICRERYCEFIGAGFTPQKLSVARVLCLAGREGLEIPEVYEPLGIPLKNIVCLEQGRKFSNELRRRNLGIQVRHQTLDELIDDDGTDPFDIISLDLTGQLGSYAHALQRLRARGRVGDHAIFFTNFCGAREAGACKGVYAWAESTSGGGPLVAAAAEIFNGLRSDRISGEVAEALQNMLGWLFAGMPRTNGTLRQRRSEAIHKGVRQMLQCLTNSLVEILFRECDRDGSLTRDVREFLHPDIVGNVPYRARDAAAVYTQQLAIARKQRNVMPPSMSKMLTDRVTERIRATVARFSNGHAGRALRMDIEAANKLLSGAIDSFIGAEQLVVAAESYKYVSDRSPMYVDMLRTRRIDKFDALREHLAIGAGTLDELLKPIGQLSLSEFNFLIDQLERGSKDLDAARWREARVPKRIELGRESALRPRRASAAANVSKKEQALWLMKMEPSLTIEDVELAVGAESTQQVAAWKAHMTMGRYPGTSVEAHERFADRELEAGRPQVALSITKRLERRNPKNVRLLTQQAKCLAHLGEQRKALAVIGKALDVEPGNVELLVRKGHLLRVSDQYDDAQRAFEEALQAEPCSIAALVGRGEVFLAQEKLVEAQSIFEAVLKVDPRCFAAKCGRASCIVALEGAESALAAFDVLARQEPDAATVWYNRAIVLLYLDRRRDAIDDLSRAVERDPDFYLAWLRLGYCFFDERAFSEAYRAFSRAAAVSPGDIEALQNLLIVCHHLRKDEEYAELSKWLDRNAPVSVTESGHAEIKRALQLVPIDHRALMERGQALFAQGLYEASVRAFGQLLKLAPDHCEALIGRAASLSHLMRFDEGLTDLYRVLDLDAEFSDIWRHIDRIRADRDRHGQTRERQTVSDIRILRF